MGDTQDSVQDKLRKLRNDFVAQVPDKVHALEQSWAAIRENPNEAQAANALYRLAHSLRGSAGTFGFVALSDASLSLETLAKSLLDCASPLTDEFTGQMTALFLLLKQAASSSQDSTEQDRGGQLRSKRSMHLDESDNKVVFLLQDDPHVAQDLAVQIGHFGYKTKIFAKVEGLAQALIQSPPVAIIMDMNFPGGGANIAADLWPHREGRVAIIFISTLSDIRFRLEAIRAGGEAYFTKPVDVSRLVDKLDALSSGLPSDGYRVLVVDDDIALSHYYALTLTEAGIFAETANDAQSAVRALKDFDPDLILLDAHLPECSGPELANVLFQDEAYTGEPVVYLYTDQEALEAGIGKDDYLRKPLQAKDLADVVGNRIARSRHLRSLVARDCLTGLYNHKRTREQLDAEVARSERHKGIFSFVMIDIDHFKAINDAYGHFAGDRVIKSLARLLRQRMRKTDYIGRFGGEEFAVVLPNTDQHNARNLLTEICVHFAGLRHVAGDMEFFATLSCGGATFPQCADVAALTEAADLALHDAKVAGRNRVVFSPAQTE